MGKKDGRRDFDRGGDNFEAYFSGLVIKEQLEMFLEGESRRRARHWLIILNLPCDVEDGCDHMRV